MWSRPFPAEFVAFILTSIFTFSQIHSAWQESKSHQALKSIIHNSSAAQQLKIISLRREGNVLRGKIQGPQSYGLDEALDWETYLNNRLHRRLGNKVLISVYTDQQTIQKAKRQEEFARSSQAPWKSLFYPVIFFFVSLIFIKSFGAVWKWASEAIHIHNKARDQKRVILNLQNHQRQIFSLLNSERRRNANLNQELSGVYSLWTNTGAELEKVKQNIVKKTQVPSTTSSKLPIEKTSDSVTQADFI